MLKAITSIAIITIYVLLAGCAMSTPPKEFAMSMPPKEFMSKFPLATNTKLYTKLDANTAAENGACKKLVLNRSYSAAIGLTVDGDLENAAQGVDQWVMSDRGNAYSLNSFKWVDLFDKTQLVVYFDTMSCK